MVLGANVGIDGSPMECLGLRLERDHPQSRLSRTINDDALGLQAHPERVVGVGLGGVYLGCGWRFWDVQIVTVKSAPNPSF